MRIPFRIEKIEIPIRMIIMIQGRNYESVSGDLRVEMFMCRLICVYVWRRSSFAAPYFFLLNDFLVSQSKTDRRHQASHVSNCLFHLNGGLQTIICPSIYRIYHFIFFLLLFYHHPPLPSRLRNLNSFDKCRLQSVEWIIILLLLSSFHFHFSLIFHLISDTLTHLY